MATKVKTAVFPVGGMGTRFLPITKACPKEMLPIIDKPLIQYVVDEAIAAGITRLVFITSYTKRAIEDYFDTNFELEYRLAQQGKTHALKAVHSIIHDNIDIIYIRQSQPRGLGDAILCAKAVIDNEPFAVLLADDIIDAKKPCLQAMVERYEQSASNMIAIEQVPKDQTHHYGIVSLKQNSQQLSAIIEKPKPAEAPSSLAVIGRYILSPAIFKCLEVITPGVGGELQLTDAIALLLQSEPFHAHAFEGRRYDCGSKLGFLQATLAFARQTEEFNSLFNQDINA